MTRIDYLCNLWLRISMILAFLISLVFLQTPAPPTQAAAPAVSVDEKSQQIIDRAITSLGGPKYRNVLTAIGKGFYTTIKDNMTQIPARFIDYIAYPDSERTEFFGDGIRTIQTNHGDTGWLFDGAVKKISDQSPAQVEDFKRTLRTSIDYLLRGYWKQDGGKITYVGRREAGVGQRNETIKLTDPDGLWIEYEFSARDGLPAKIIYKRQRKDPDSGDMVETSEEDHLLKFVDIDGVMSPFVLDHFINGHQTSRVNYESMQYNQRFADNLFTKPDNVKAIK